MVKKVLIFGGSGFLGRNLIKYYLNLSDSYTSYQITSVSRSETRIVEAKQFIQSYASNVKKDAQPVFVVGDMSDESFVNKTIFSSKPDIVIIAAAMKHIHLCEENPQQATKVNVIGTSNVVNAVSRLREVYPNVKLCFVSTDKAADPIGSYGYSKALAERIVLNEASTGHNTVVRYGNVLNSPMSIIPMIRGKIASGDKNLTLTDERMTRFIMSVEQSVELINFALSDLRGKGAVCVPNLQAMYIKDLLELYAEKYNCEVKTLNNAVNEKYDERMVGFLEKTRLVKERGLTSLVENGTNRDIYVVGSNITNPTGDDSSFISSTKKQIVSKEELKNILEELDLLHIH